jgi:hypothetical protein
MPTRHVVVRATTPDVRVERPEHGKVRVVNAGVDIALLAFEHDRLRVTAPMQAPALVTAWPRYAVAPFFNDVVVTDARGDVLVLHTAGPDAATCKATVEALLDALKA